jgi:hypothetical protein
LYDRLTVAHTASATDRQQYASELAGLWQDLSAVLTRLERTAADRQALEDCGDDLSRLQYGLHRASEFVRGIVPPRGSEETHADLTAALEHARDATGDVRDVLETEGADAAWLLVHEWRGALFGVRLARRRLAPASAPEPVLQDLAQGFNWPAAFATVLVVAGTAAFAAGAVAALWPVWALGLGLVATSFLVFR